MMILAIVLSSALGGGNPHQIRADILRNGNFFNFEMERFDLGGKWIIPVVETVSRSSPLLLAVRPKLKVWVQSKYPFLLWWFMGQLFNYWPQPSRTSTVPLQCQDNLPGLPAKHIEKGLIQWMGNLKNKQTRKIAGTYWVCNIICAWQDQIRCIFWHILRLNICLFSSL